MNDTTNVSTTNTSAALTPWVSEAIEVLRDQKVFFEMLASMYYAPLTQAQIDSIAQADFAYDADDATDLISQGFRQMKTYLARKSTDTRLELNMDYTGAFYGVTEYEGNVATPYESIFRGKKKLLNQEPRKEVYTDYKKQALTLEDTFNTPEDHLSFELQFLGILADRTVQAFQKDDYLLAAETINTQKTFLEDHVMSWFEDFANQANKVLETDFYKGALKITQGFIELAHDSLTAIEEDLSTKGAVLR